LLYTSLSTELTDNVAKKKNLTGAGHGFWFRVSRGTKIATRVDKKSMDYVGHACRRPFQVLTMMEQSKRMPVPNVRIDTAAASADPKSYVAHVSWTVYQDPLLAGYKLQMRENKGDAFWTTVAACLSGTEVRKKNLTSKYGYMFRVRPVLQGESGGDEDNLVVSVHEGGNTIPFSSPSVVVGKRKSRSGSITGGGTSTELMKLFKGLPNDTFLAKGGISKVPLSEAFGNVDLVFLYASASWCPPCKKYTPQVIKFYNDAKHMYAKAPNVTKSIEVVFLSADHDIAGFKSYYASMPFLAVPYDCPLREKLMAHIKVTGVPRFVCMDGKTGKILESNSVGRALDLERFSRLATGKGRLGLK
jgi:thiol-disulfide isomerase/thioredoxin